MKLFILQFTLIAAFLSVLITSGCKEAKYHPNIITENVIAKPLDTSCEAAEKWATKNKNKLKFSYAEISDFPETYQKAIFRLADAKSKTRIWKKHLQQFLKASYLLNTKQTKYLNLLIKNLNGEIFKKQTVDNTLFENTSNLKRVFGNILAKKIFTKLTPPNNSSNSVHLVKKTNRLTTTFASGECGCSVDDDWCSGFDGGIGPQLLVCGGGTECGSSSWGCGTFWIEACNGECVEIEPE